jgi:transcriptional regulator with XRE-family HTH domain
MTQRDMAGYLGVTPMTLRNWRKEKPNLYKIVMKGFELEKAVEEARLHYESLKKLSEGKDK